MIGAAATNYTIDATNSSQVTNWINFRQAASAVLSNLTGNPMNTVTQILAGANVTVTSNNAGIYTIAATAGSGGGWSGSYAVASNAVFVTGNTNNTNVVIEQFATATDNAWSRIK